MSKSIEDLREALFSTLQGVKDGSIDVDKARAINELGKTICDTAKVEVDYIKAAGGESQFLEKPKDVEPLPVGITGITQHRLRG